MYISKQKHATKSTVQRPEHRPEFACCGDDPACHRVREGLQQDCLGDSFTIFWVFTLVFCCVVHIDTTVGTAPPAANQNSNTVPVAAAALHQAPNEVGLAPTAIRALPTFVHKKAPSQSGESSDRGAEMCSVCLEVIQEGETVRQLPVCLHLFHMGCVDMWLGSHSTCPVCRSAIVLLDCA
uniref:RING-type E3 ubiquitin transferase n=1 Tax=Ananas comosus var. bracteatus TaxID=296719 RepID=A0A6V7QHJ8_ANACO|nr:unnamed protein product [Ananas comosus var. bracteatus]